MDIQEILEKLEKGTLLNEQEASFIAEETKQLLSEDNSYANNTISKIFRPILPDNLDYQEYAKEISWAKSLTTGELKDIFLRYDILSGRGMEKYYQNYDTHYDPQFVEGNELTVNNLVSHPDANRYILKNSADIKILNEKELAEYSSRPKILGQNYDIMRMYIDLINEKNGVDCLDLYLNAFNNCPFSSLNKRLTPEAALNITNYLGDKKNDINLGYGVSSYGEVAKQLAAENNIRYPESTYKYRKEAILNAYAEFELNSETSIKDIAKNFNELPDEQKIEFAESIAKYYFEILEQPIPEIKIDNNMDSRGSSGPKGIKLNLNKIVKNDSKNKENFTSFTSTLFHEINHQWQRNLSSDYINGISKNEDDKLAGKIFTVNNKFDDFHHRNRIDHHRYIHTPIEFDSFLIGEYSSDAILGYISNSTAEITAIDKKYGAELVIKKSSSFSMEELEELGKHLGMHDSYTDFNQHLQKVKNNDIEAIRNQR